MKAIINIALVLAAVSFVVGIISRITITPVGPMNIEAQAFLQLTNTCLLAAIALGISELLKSKA